jgi:hypothetical protein
MKIVISTTFLSIAFIIICICYKQITSPSITRVPITFSASKTPLVMTKIEDATYFLQVDLGSKFPLTLSQEILESIQKKPHGTAIWRDLKGNCYESFAYFISKIKFNQFEINNLFVSQENETFHQNATLWNSSIKDEPFHNEYVGSIGFSLLEKANLLLDFPHLIMLICKDTNKFKLKTEGFDIEKMIKVPFKISRTGITLEATCDIGDLKLSIDTGSTISLVRTARLIGQKCNKKKHEFDIFTSSKFIINKNDFGEIDFYLFELTPNFDEIDGILGMDFLNKHIIYIDYKNKFVYIDKNY